MWESLKSLFGNAAVLATKRAELGSLDSVTMPKLFYAVGKEVAARDSLPSGLEPLRTRIQEKTEAMKCSEPPTTTQHEHGLKSLIARQVRTASKAASDAGVKLQLTAEYVQLGRAAVQDQGHDLVPANLAADVRSATDRRSRLLAEIAALEANAGVGLFSVPRMATLAMFGVPILVGGIVLVALGYPLIAAYALARLGVLVATVIATYVACVAIWSFVKSLVKPAVGAAVATNAGLLKAPVARACMLLALLWLLPAPATPHDTAPGRDASAEKPLARRSPEPATERRDDRQAQLAADTFMRILFQAAAMDQTARQSMGGASSAPTVVCPQCGGSGKKNLGSSWQGCPVCWGRGTIRAGKPYSW